MDNSNLQKPVLPPPQPIITQKVGLRIKKRPLWRRIVFWSGIGLLAAGIAALVTGWFVYQSLLSPVGTNKNEHIKITVVPNMTPSEIGQALADNKVIRSELAFGIYTRLAGNQNKLQAGTYRLSPSESTPQIVEHLTKGNVDSFDITFLPGATLAQNRQVLLDAGYSAEEVDAGLSARYESPLFDGKPASADLEGYIYGDTYRFGSGATVSQILLYTFDSYEKVVEENGLVEKFADRGLTLYQGITLASIVQREGTGTDYAQIAQVFYSRLEIGMMLGSDVTYQYIADKTGVTRDPALDSPYNTRRYNGLPPGPIAVPGLRALLAVANPAEGDYFFFLSGDDDVTYFARTVAEHEQNIVDHCKIKCLII